MGHWLNDRKYLLSVEFLQVIQMSISIAYDMASGVNKVVVEWWSGRCSRSGNEKIYLRYT